MIDTNNLLPCPFCGSDPSYFDIKYQDRKAEYGINCHDCLSSIGSFINGYETKELAKVAWNTRAYPNIESIKKVTLDPDDILILRFKYPLSSMASERLKQYFVDRGIENELLVFDHEVEMDVFKKDSPKALDKCPSCGGEADNGHDRCIPPSTYNCTKCANKY